MPEGDRLAVGSVQSENYHITQESHKLKKIGAGLNWINQNKIWLMYSTCKTSVLNKNNGCFN